jgi:hypothetical protein
MRLSHDQVVAGLVKRGVPQHVAEGVSMNFQDESGLDTGVQEHAPTSGRGGFGLAQWTGPRRIQLEDFARSQGKSIDDPDAQLDFFMAENAGPEKGAWNAVMNTPNAQEAASSFVRLWERPASKHVADRTAKYMSGHTAPGVGPTGPVPVKPGTAGAPPTAAPVVQPQAPTEAPNNDWSTSLASMGGGGQTSALPSSTVPRIPASMTMAEMTPTANTTASDQMRAQLAQRLALLNSGKLWAG